MPIDHEEPMARSWWPGRGLTLCWKYPLVRGVRGATPRWIDGAVEPDADARWIDGKDNGWLRFGTDVRGRDVSAVQAKACALTSPLIGQTIISGVLLQRAGSVSRTTYAMVTRRDPALALIADRIAARFHLSFKCVIEPAPDPVPTFRLYPKRTDIERAYETFHMLDGHHLYHNVPISETVMAHAAVFFDGTWERGSTLAGRSFILLSHPNGYGFGMYVLGEAMVLHELATSLYPTAEIMAGIVVPRDDAVMHPIADELKIKPLILTS